MITKINDHYYNLTDFKHPGGDIAISHAKNRDATILFNTYHPFNKHTILKRIEKYKINEPKTDKIITPKQFNFDSEFSNELIKEVSIYFKHKSNKADTTKWLYIYITTSLHIISLYYFILGYQLAIFIEPFLAWISSVNYFHDACHFALINNDFINTFFMYHAMFLSQPYDWFHQHNLGHHSYTNIKEIDPDSHSNTMTKTIVKLGKKYNIGYKPILLFIWSIAVYDLLFIEPIKSYINNYYNNNNLLFDKNNTYIAICILFKCIYILIYLIIPIYHYSFPLCLLYVFISRSIFSCLFMTFTQVSHNQIILNGNNKDWYKHQLLTTSNYATNNRLLFYLSGGLTNQIEHHLFPFINHCHLPNIQPIVKRVCKKHGVLYIEYSTYQKAFNHYLKYLLT